MLWSVRADEVTQGREVGCEATPAPVGGDAAGRHAPTSCIVERAPRCQNWARGAISVVSRTCRECEVTSPRLCRITSSPFSSEFPPSCPPPTLDKPHTPTCRRIKGHCKPYRSGCKKRRNLSPHRQRATHQRRTAHLWGQGVAPAADVGLLKPIERIPRMSAQKGVGILDNKVCAIPDIRVVRRNRVVGRRWRLLREQARRGCGRSCLRGRERIGAPWLAIPAPVGNLAARRARRQARMLGRGVQPGGRHRRLGTSFYCIPQGCRPYYGELFDNARSSNRPPGRRGPAGRSELGDASRSGPLAGCGRGWPETDDV